MESAKNFCRRVEARTGIGIDEIPDGSDGDWFGGSIVCSSPHGTVIFVDQTGDEDEDGCAIYLRAVMMNRAPALPRAKPGATGFLPVSK